MHDVLAGVVLLARARSLGRRQAVDRGELRVLRDLEQSRPVVEMVISDLHCITPTTIDVTTQRKSGYRCLCRC